MWWRSWMLIQRLGRSRLVSFHAEYVNETAATREWQALNPGQEIEIGLPPARYLFTELPPPPPPRGIPNRTGPSAEHLTFLIWRSMPAPHVSMQDSCKPPTRIRPYTNRTLLSQIGR